MRILLTEEIARTTLGGNYERIVRSIDKCTETVKSLPAGASVADLGGGCGITCFEAAQLRPDIDFVVADRSKNSLAIGCKWSSLLSIQNIQYRQFEFDRRDPLSELGSDKDLVFLDYVLDVAADNKTPFAIARQMSPALHTAACITKIGGLLQIRFGQFSPEGFSTLIRLTFRRLFELQEIEVSEAGFTLMFSREAAIEGTEGYAVNYALDYLGQQIRRADD